MSRTKKAIIIALAALGLAASGGAIAASHGPAQVSATHYWGKPG